MSDLTRGKLEEDALYWAADVARDLFGRSLQWFYRHRAKLHAAEAFPHPISEIGRPRWSGSSLLAWQRRIPLGASAPSDPCEPAGPNVIDFERRLKERAQAIAKKRRG